MLFNAKPMPAFPGVALFSTISDCSDVVYIPLKAPSSASVREQLRRIFELCERSLPISFDGKREKWNFEDRLGAALLLASLPYVRTGKTSIREWLVRSVILARKHGGAIVSAVGKLVKPGA